MEVIATKPNFEKIKQKALIIDVRDNWEHQELKKILNYVDDFEKVAKNHKAQCYEDSLVPRKKKIVNMNQTNKLEIAQIPPQVGCYLLQDQQKKVIYVGKAKNLRQRIARHFQESQSKYLGLISNWEIILTNNAKEALILEQNLIKKYQPRFNILLRDNHTYPYIKITEETNPRYWLVKKFNPLSKDLYFGPFPDGTKAREILQILEKVFPLAKCKGNLGKPCLDYSLGQCSGHCFKKVEPEYYQRTKQKIIDFFQGKTQVVKKELQRILQKSIANQEFELAKKEKKILDNLSFFVSEQNVEFPYHESYDFFGFYSQAGLLTCFFLIYRYGKLSTTETQIFPIQEGLNEEKELLQSYLYQFYQKNLPPKILYLSEKLENQELLAAEFGFTCQIPQRGKKKKILTMAQQNAYHVWQRNYTGSLLKSDKISLLEELGRYLHIETPYFLEILDVSNLFQQDVVAGFLVYLNGEKAKKKSKIYQLTTSKKKSDTSWISEACRQHYKKCKYLPQLLLVDGGKPQVKAVLDVCWELSLKVPVVGLVKNEKHQTEKIITSEFQELPLPANEELKNFLVNLQEECHHYVISFHRKLHRENVLKY
ncbi:excinuclease ABC subunit UvrC [endosymbiont GvMRE of Glomus versiforme]|uniref:excinuclease ABC subunit UvrC n=1 Tax=endosymbiont GvMRE of Glomus versiforme TaxID=2039283 RepID=UPI000EE8E9CF|nr:excinuclease ABC subunit UvrC [endosymbiont GvMRE of Glomus versiforme]RHZ37013.1 UvrABC system protein C [endosymbiont GvMRE of Glomus versiforme]